MATVLEKNVVDIIKERKSVRKYKTDTPIPQDTLKQILSLAGQAPSSWNLQHWKFLVVQEKENKQKLLPIAYNQQQVADASAVIVVLGDVEANKNVDLVFDEVVRLGYMTEEAKQRMASNINAAYESSQQVGVHLAIQNASLAAMQLMIAAKAFGLDTCPMGGFDAAALRQELNIPARYIPVMMITVGYAAEPAHQTLRLPLDQVVIEEKF